MCQEEPRKGKKNVNLLNKFNFDSLSLYYMQMPRKSPSPQAARQHNFVVNTVIQEKTHCFCEMSVDWKYGENFQE